MIFFCWPRFSQFLNEHHDLVYLLSQSSHALIFSTEKKWFYSCCYLCGVSGMFSQYTYIEGLTLEKLIRSTFSTFIHENKTTITSTQKINFLFIRKVWKIEPAHSIHLNTPSLHIYLYTYYFFSSKILSFWVVSWEDMRLWGG